MNQKSESKTESKIHEDLYPTRNLTGLNLKVVASIAILFHSVFIDPYSWFFIRILTGVSLSGIYVIMESWLNDKSTNQNRGNMLATYMVITFTFLGLGQFLLNISNPIEVDLFILFAAAVFALWIKTFI